MGNRWIAILLWWPAGELQNYLWWRAGEVHFFAVVASRWTVFYLSWRAGELQFISGGEQVNCILSVVVSRWTAIYLWWRAGELYFISGGEQINFFCPVELQFLWWPICELQFYSGGQQVNCNFTLVARSELRFTLVGSTLTAINLVANRWTSIISSGQWMNCNFTLVASRWTAIYLWWRVGKLQFYSRGE